MRAGTFIEQQKVKLGEYLNVWLEQLPVSGRGVATVSSYRHNMRLHVVPELGDLQLQDLVDADLDRLYRRLLRDGKRNGMGGLSNRTVRYIHTILSAALTDAVSKGLLSRNPSLGATPPSSKSAKAPEMAWWRPGELRTFLELTAGHELGPLFRLAGATWYAPR